MGGVVRAACRHRHVEVGGAGRHDGGGAANADVMYRVALDGYEKSLWKDHRYTKNCAKNLVVTLEDQGGGHDDEDW